MLSGVAYVLATATRQICAGAHQLAYAGCRQLPLQRGQRASRRQALPGDQGLPDAGQWVSTKASHAAGLRPSVHHL